MKCKIIERVLKDRKVIIGEKREKHDTKNTKIKVMKKPAKGDRENQQREEILVEEALMIYNDEKNK